MRGRATRLVVACLLACATAAGAPSPPAPEPTFFLHLSDVHMSINVDKYWDLFGDRQGDLELFARALGPVLAPAAVLITGDLVDAKTPHGAARQHEAEWKAYRSAIDAFVAVGVPEAAILDVRGNHDTFNVPLRGGASDYFSRYAAEGRRSGHARRVYPHALLPAGGGLRRLCTADAASGFASEPACDTRAAAAAADAACPAALLLGIDASPDVGLGSPGNFAGRAPPELLAEVEAALVAAEAEHAEREAAGASCPRPPLLAYLHYPLAVVHHAWEGGGGALGALRGLAAHAAQPLTRLPGLAVLLARANATAVLAGHLHASFGFRLHSLHATPAGSHMAELETVAWKDDRRFRVVGLDGGALAFEEFHFHTPGTPPARAAIREDAAATRDPAWAAAYGRRGWGVTSPSPGAAAIDHVVLVSSPADARYSPLHGAADREAPSGLLRAAVFSLDAAAVGGLEVRARGWLPDGRLAFDVALQPEAGSSQGRGAALFTAEPVVAVACGAGEACEPARRHLTLQVTARSGDGPRSSSRLQPARLACARGADGAGLRCRLGGGGEPLPLGAGALARLCLAVHWPAAMQRVFLGLWAFLVFGMLGVPRLLRARLAPRMLRSALLLGGPTEAARAAPARAARALLGWALWPWASLALLATATRAWLPTAVYSAALLVGPWGAAALLDGHPHALVLSFGVLQRPALEAGGFGPWRYLSTPDSMFVSLIQLALCVIPTVLWVACVLGRRVAAGAGGGAGGGTGTPLFSTPQLAALALLAIAQLWLMETRYVRLMGPAALLVSPGLGWTVPLALLATGPWALPRRRAAGARPAKCE